MTANHQNVQTALKNYVPNKVLACFCLPGFSSKSPYIMTWSRIMIYFLYHSYPFWASLELKICMLKSFWHMICTIFYKNLFSRRTQHRAWIHFHEFKDQYAVEIHSTTFLCNFKFGIFLYNRNLVFTVSIGSWSVSGTKWG